MKNEPLSAIHFLILLYEIAERLGINTNDPAWWDKKRDDQVQQVFNAIAQTKKSSAIPSATDKVKTIIAIILHMSPEEIKEGQHIINDLGADSLDVVEITMETENVFNIEITDAQIENLKTVEDVIDFVESKS